MCIRDRDVIRQLDEDQDSVVNNTPDVITTCLLYTSHRLRKGSRFPRPAAAPRFCFPLPQRKLCIAVALAHHPKLLLLDEATNGLDPVVRDEVTDILLDFARDEEHSILISSHIVSDLEKLCDTIAFLHKGRLLLCEEKDALREEYALWHGTAAQLAALDTRVYGKRVTPYGVEALVRRDAMPAGAELAPVSIEELFVLMVKGECAA